MRKYFCRHLHSSLISMVPRHFKMTMLSWKFTKLGFDIEPCARITLDSVGQLIVGTAPVTFVLSNKPSNLPYFGHECNRFNSHGELTDIVHSDPRWWFNVKNCFYSSYLSMHILIINFLIPFIICCFVSYIF